MFHDFTKAINRKLWWHRYRKYIFMALLLVLILPDPFPWWMRVANWFSSWFDTPSSSQGYGGGGGGAF